MSTYDEDHTINQCKNIFIVETKVAELKEQVVELRKEIATLRQEIVKKGEEIKDVFYVADVTRARIDEVDDYLRNGIESLNEVVRKCKAESEAKHENINQLREEVLSIKEKLMTKAPKIFAQAIKIASIVLVILLLLFPKLHQLLDSFSK